LKSSDIKVALISDEFPPHGFGGIASVCFDLANNLSKKKIHTNVFCGRSKKITVKKLNDYLTIVRLPYLDLPPRSAWFQIQNLNVFSDVLKHHNLIHVVSPTSGTLFAFFKRRIDMPLITSIHGIPIRDQKVFVNSPLKYWTTGDFVYNILEYPFYHFFTKAILQNSDHILACNTQTLHDVRNFYSGIASNKISLIPNGIDFENIENNEDYLEERKERNGQTIIYYGRLYWRKGIIHLVKALVQVRRDYPNCNFQIFGKGPLKNKLKKMILKLKLETNTEIKGHVPVALDSQPVAGSLILKVIEIPICLVVDI